MTNKQESEICNLCGNPGASVAFYKSGDSAVTYRHSDWQNIAKRLSQLGLLPHQVQKHLDQLRVANQPKPKNNPTEPSREQIFDGWTSGRAC